ncbi:MAG TPA: hypothetical protein VM325_17280 [Alphaproteobacteria bacterium]|nr:hypothetical protein [Alphaproteobacteria bacterium]
MASIEIKVLISLAALGSVYAFIRDIQRTARRRRLAVWVKQHYPLEWRAIDWGRRNLFLAAALARLFLSGTITDPHFMQEYPNVRRWPLDMMLAFAVACGAIALVAVGQLYLGWTW